MTDNPTSNDEAHKAHIIELYSSINTDWDKNFDEKFNRVDDLMAEFGTFALKAALLIGGGGLLSLFAFFSQILTSENTEKSVLMSVFSSFRNSVIFWIVSICCCLLTIGLTYAHYYLQANIVSFDFKKRWQQVYQAYPDEFSHLKPTWLDAGGKFAPWVFGISIVSGYMSVLLLFGGFWFCIKFVFSFPSLFP